MACSCNSKFNHMSSNMFPALTDCYQVFSCIRVTACLFLYEPKVKCKCLCHVTYAILKWGAVKVCNKVSKITLSTTTSVQIKQQYKNYPNTAKACKTY